ncbi:xylulokinase [Thermocatellispora tengchongensis]|uniref:Xylulokinase n=1 Tax=Thermocatellispora tengchongensis TaxID=1073253 RepID=A0A840P0N8_9ACTN|nr:FGGY family carbohydrate kinase [Thermocatellispora tengchongensis]MBB5131461.1 xylulokinase [Thermocatellispora tengchongensis]
MPGAVLALDLGTGGCKASLWSAEGACLAETVTPYATHHSAVGRNEQRPADWWDAVTAATRELLAGGVPIEGIALSGQSLGAVMLDSAGRPVEELTPIWSDARAVAQAEALFTRVPEETWYLRTGNGFPPGLYPLFKAMWFREHAPESWRRARTLIGSKDYVNHRLTGVIATDHSYASGSGAYDLLKRAYDPELLAAAGLDPALLPPIREATDVIGGVTAEAAAALGVPSGTPVLAGAVDNSCMALGSRGTRPGRVFASLGSSSWITVTSDRPVLDPASRPYVFAHAVPGLFISALSTFSSGTSIEWLRDLIAPGIPVAELVSEACQAPPGARGALMLPMLSGGTPIEGGPSARGVLMGLDLAHERRDIARAGLEGVAFALRRSLDAMRALAECDAELLISGGGGRHPGWNQIYADVLGVPLTRTAVDQQAATLGAAAIAFVGLGLWPGFDRADAPHVPVERYEPDPAAAPVYEAARARFDAAVRALAGSPHLANGVVHG